MKKILLIIIFLIISNIDTFSRETHDYAIIKGENVIFREKPSTNSKKIKEFRNGELVFDPVQSEKKTKIGNDEYYWYKIQTQDKKEGWVFGKYILVYDKNDELYMALKNIIDNNWNGNWGMGVISEVKIEKDDKYDYILLRYLWSGSLEASDRLIFYRKEGNEYKCVINNGFENDNYYINNKYIYLWSPKLSVRVYDRNKLDKNMYYERVRSLSVYGVHRAKYNYDSYIEFDLKTEISTMHWREKEGAPMKIEKYRFNGTKFDQLE